jgi:DNA-binding NarL/FixJ family response regulator
MTGRRTRVLLVDDRDQVRSMLRDVLTGFDCVFTEAEDGERALELIETDAFDVIVLDYKLPGISGIDVLVEARRRVLVLGKVIVLTFFPEINIPKEASELVFRFISKTSMTRDGIRGAFQDAIGIAPAATIPSGGGRSPRSRKRSSARNDPRPSLLLVDSDSSSLNEMVEILSEDFSPIPAKDADDAFQKLARRTPELVVLDVNLAGNVSGLDLLRRMRKSVPTLRAIMISKELDPEAVFESAQSGALKYVLKSQLASLPTMIKRIRTDRSAARVFLCYARADVAIVSRLYNRLMKKGFLPWMDEKSLRVGSDWELEIEKAIKEAHFFVFFASTNSVGREGPMRREVKLALRRQDEKVSPFFIPARLEDCPRDPSLERFQHLDLFKRNGFAVLVAALST